MRVFIGQTCVMLLLLIGTTACRDASIELGEITYVSGAILEGDACDLESTSVQCHSDGPVFIMEHGESCVVGTRSCRDGVWSACEELEYVEPIPSLTSDGVLREAIIGSTVGCGGCDPRCVVTRDQPEAADFGHPLVEINGVIGGATGGVVIGGPSGASSRNAWISSHSSNVVNKLSFATLSNAGVYRTGSDGEGSDPSRTALDGGGYVYVGNRDNASVTKIAGELSQCIEVNGTAGIQTSTGVADLLGAHDAPNRDECILWDTEIAGGSGGPRAVAVDGRGRLWVGLRDDDQYWVLDTESGAILHGPIDVDHAPYGAAIGSDGILWSAATNDTIQAIDTRTANPTNADVQRPPINSPGSVYGVAVDGNGRVYVASGNDLSMYDPSIPAWTPGVTSGARGLSVHADGYVYVAGQGDGIIEHDFNTLAETRRFPVAGSPRGCAPDFFNRVWGASSAATASVVDLATGAINYVPTYGGNYTYSDFTGYGFGVFTNPSGHFVRVYDSSVTCGVGVTATRAALNYVVETPDTTVVQFYAKSADTRAVLTNAPEVYLGDAPPESGGMDVISRMLAAGRDPSARFLAIRVSLRRNGSDQSPVLRELMLQEYCEW